MAAKPKRKRGVGSNRAPAKRKKRLSGVAGLRGRAGVSGRRRRRTVKGIAGLGSNMQQVAINGAVAVVSGIGSAYALRAAFKNNADTLKYVGLIQIGVGLAGLFASKNETIQAGGIGMLVAGGIRAVGDLVLKEKKGDLGLLGDEDAPALTGGMGFVEKSNDAINTIGLPTAGASMNGDDYLGEDDLGEDDLGEDDLGDDDMSGLGDDDLGDDDMSGLGDDDLGDDDMSGLGDDDLGDDDMSGLGDDDLGEDDLGDDDLGDDDGLGEIIDANDSPTSFGPGADVGNMLF